MPAKEILPNTDCYRVEVSGWDHDDIHFVEKYSLDGDQSADKYVILKHMLP